MRVSYVVADNKEVANKGESVRLDRPFVMLSSRGRARFEPETLPRDCQNKDLVKHTLIDIPSSKLAYHFAP